MKRLLLLASAFVALAIGGGAIASTASAANCTYNGGGSNGVIGHGAGAYVYFQATLSCTHIEGVRFYTQPPGAGSATGWYDYNGASWASSYIGSCGVNNCSGDIRPSPYIQIDATDFPYPIQVGNGLYVWQRSSVWYYGQCRVIAQNLWYQIKNPVGHNWGSYAEYFQGYTGINTCISA